MTTENRVVTGTSPDDRDTPASSSLPRGQTVTIAFAVVLYLLVFGRWGSHVGVPGLPVFVADVGLAAALVHTAHRVRRQGCGMRDVGAAARTAHLALLLAGALLGWTALRAVAGTGSFLAEPLSALRDIAPYGYAVVALAAFLVPVTSGARLRGLLYAGLTVHLAWMVLAPLLPGWPRQWPELGEAAIFTPRPDFDAAVLGVAVALALHELLTGSSAGMRHRLALAGFGLANAAVLATSPTRAGLLAAVAAIGTVLAGHLHRSRRRQVGHRSSRSRRVVAAVLLAAAATSVVALTPAGQRLGQSFGSGDESAVGTLQAREYTWSGVSEYVLSDAVRTAVGVGFGPDFIGDSGTSFALEGTEYKDVRSPHNYLIGTFARLGVAGALLVAALVAAACTLAWQTLQRTRDTIDTAAALLLLALPVTAMLGVVLESPFGAIPYFWAVGHLSRRTRDREQHGTA